MSIVAIVPLEDDDAAHLAAMAHEGGMTLNQMCASILACVAIDDRRAHQPSTCAAHGSAQGPRVADAHARLPGDAGLNSSPASVSVPETPGTVREAATAQAVPGTNPEVRA